MLASEDAALKLLAVRPLRRERHAASQLVCARTPPRGCAWLAGDAPRRQWSRALHSDGAARAEAHQTVLRRGCSRWGADRVQ